MISRRSLALFFFAAVAGVCLSGLGAEATVFENELLASARELLQAAANRTAAEELAAISEDRVATTIGSKLIASALKAPGATPISKSTIFLPSDEAFNGLDVTVRSLDDFFNATLSPVTSAILKLHVVPTVVKSSAITAVPINATAASGDTLSVFLVNGTVEVDVVGTNNSAAVVKADIPYNDNIVHIIDTVLLPSDAAVAALLAAPPAKPPGPKDASPVGKEPGPPGAKEATVPVVAVPVAKAATPKRA